MMGADITAEGGGIVAVVVALFFVFATIVIGGWVALVAYRGYRRAGDRPRLFLAAGIALISTGHTVLRVVFSNLEVPALLSNSMPVAVQFSGLLLILYAISGRPSQGRYRELLAITIGGVLVLVAPYTLHEATAVDRSFIVAGVNGVTALLGGFVALQAYRGYWRYRSVPMLLLSVGIVMLAVAPFIVLLVLLSTAFMSDAVGLAAVWLVQLAGLVSILRSLTV